MRRLFLFSLLTFLPLLAPSDAAADPAGARQFAEMLGDTVIDTVRENSRSPEEKRAALEAMFNENVDTDWIGRFVLGRHWREATEEQRARYLAYYRKYLVRYYTSKFTNYRGESFRILDVKENGNGAYAVTMRIVRPNQPPILSEYKVREQNGVYRIYDIVLEGVSLITTQRADFGSAVSRRGIDYLIDQLAKKVTAPPDRE